MIETLVGIVVDDVVEGDIDETGNLVAVVYFVVGSSLLEEAPSYLLVGVVPYHLVWQGEEVSQLIILFDSLSMALIRKL